MTVANAPDTTPPTVTLTAPAGTVSGTVAVTANAADNAGVTQVEFFADATSLGTDTSAPYSVDWNTTTVADGDVTLTAVAHDAATNTTTSTPVVVTVSNAVVVTLAQLQTDIFTPRCAFCHTGPTGNASCPGHEPVERGGELMPRSWVSRASKCPHCSASIPGNPDNSYIIQKLEGRQPTVGARMPLNGPPLSQAEIDQVRAWISSGAPNN